MMTTLRRRLPDIVQYSVLSLAAFLSIFPCSWNCQGAVVGFGFQIFARASAAPVPPEQPASSAKARSPTAHSVNFEIPLPAIAPA